MNNTLVTVVVTGFATGVVPLCVAWLAYRQSVEANRQARVLENRKVDAEAFMRAQTIYQEAIATLEGQLVSYRESIATLDRQLVHARARITDLERRVNDSDRID